MLIQHIIFYFFAAIVVGSSAMVVTLSNPVRCALFLVLAFLGAAGLWLLAYAEFLALVLVLVYVGAVMTLFLFVIMMLDINVLPRKRQLIKYLPFGLAVVVLFVLLLVVAIQPENFALKHLAVKYGADYNNTKQLGLVLYTHYAYAFELAAVLLLVAIIAAIALSHRVKGNAKRQQVLKQILVRSEQRVRLVKMPIERDAHDNDLEKP